MADEYYNNKIVTTDGDVLMDLTQDTATPEAVLEGETFHLRSGAPATGTYRPSDEIEARLRATVGHSSKNLLDLDKHNAYPSGMEVSELDADTGSIVATATGSLRGINYLNSSLGLEPNDGASYIVSLNNNEVNTNGRLTIRSRGDNKVRYQVSLRTVGKKELEFTADPELFPSGWYISLLVTGSASETASIDVSGLMLREASITDDTFEPYVTPTDEKKQDKIKTIYVAPSLEKATDEVIIPRSDDIISVYIVFCLAYGDTDTAVTFIVSRELQGFPCVNGDFSITELLFDPTHNKLKFDFPNTFSAGKIIRVLEIPNISYEVEV